MKSQISNLKSQNYCKGQALIITILILMPISLLIISGFSAIVLKEYSVVRDLFISKRSYFLAESGVEDAMYRIKKNKNISSNEIIYLDGGSANTMISTDISGDKDIVSTSDFSSNIRKVEMKLITSVTGVDFFYGAQVGMGGLIMNQNSRIEGASGSPGNVYSNGPISGSNGAIITGDATVATGVTEDNQARSIVCSNPPDGEQIVGKTDPEIDVSQSFIPADSKPLAKISLYIKKVSNPSDRNVYITADNSGSPSQTSLAQGTLYATLVGTNYNWIDVVFSSPANLTSGQTYWIILDASQSSSKYWVWCKDKNQGFGNGVAKYSQSWTANPWTIIVGDLTFKTYLGEGFSIIEDVTVNGIARANKIEDSSIGGDAYYQTIINTSVGGISYPGSVDPPIEQMPISQANIDQWKTDAAVGGEINGNCGDGGDPQCIIGDNGTLSIGPKKINGNLILTKKQTLNVTGTLYFTGYLDINSAGGAILKCDPSYGSNSCIIITDSWVAVKNNTTFQGSGTAGSYIMGLTTLSGCNGGTQQAWCTDHNSAIDFLNNATGAIFYAPYSMVHLHNGINITEIVANKLELENTAVVTYEQGLINSNFSSGPAGGWSIDKWKEGQ